MPLYPPEIRRCCHIRANGTQCGSPALRNQELCYYHRESQPQRVEVSGENGKPCGHVLVPVFEDAASIQNMVRQVTILLLEGKIDTKKSGQILYALQIASSNLKRMAEEKPRPVQVVIDEEKVADTPLGLAPWSATEKGYELDEPADIATERALSELEYEWKNAYGNIWSWIVGRKKYIERFREQFRNADETDLSNFLSEIQDSLARRAEIMAENLEKKLSCWPVRGCETLPRPPEPN